MSASVISGPVWLNDDSCQIEDFKQLVETELPRSSVPLAAEIISNIPIYDASEVKKSLNDDQQSKAYMREWHENFLNGSGIVVFRNAFTDMQLIDDVTGVFNDIIAFEESQPRQSGDHFAPSGANSRIWNAHEKLCMKSPELFVRYNTNNIIPLISRSWLGPQFQITTQVNVVRPGGKAQNCHRDYHLGFLQKEALWDFPTIVHQISPTLTLQGAVAHSDMPIESGPTKLLPFSQRYLQGYIAAHLPDFITYFEEHHVQLPLRKGDAAFFNPATFHAAGENSTKDIHRFANLMQIGSAFGRSIEIVDRARISKTIYPVLARLKTDGAISMREVENVIAGSAEGYPFPANLDLDSPTSAMAPSSQQDILRQALNEGWSREKFDGELDAHSARKRSH